MRRPIPLRRTGLTAKDFRLIGEIVVLSGMIEDTLKRIPLAMLQVLEVPGMALVAHQPSGALCDTILAITPYFVASEKLNAEVGEAIAHVRGAANLRNEIVHGPFSFDPDSSFKGTRKVTARSVLKMAERSYEAKFLEDALQKHIMAWKAISSLYVGVVFIVDARLKDGAPVLRDDFEELVNEAQRQVESQMSDDSINI